MSFPAQPRAAPLRPNHAPLHIRRPTTRRFTSAPSTPTRTSHLGLDELDKRLFNSGMGRIAGVAATQTRERLLQAAAEVFAERGYDGTRVADIATAAGVSNGALYAHFGSKAELLVAALRAHGRRLLAEMLAADPGAPVTDLLVQAGRGLPQRPDARGYLMVEALVAARRDADVAGPMKSY